MTHDIRIEDAALTPIRGLKPHPANARRGDVDAIAASLARHGQYRPIVITTDRVILAGHHVVQAAKSLKWTRIAAVTVDVDEQTALKILAADNRTADLATYDNGALIRLLESLDSLDGTGYGPTDIAQLDALIGGDGPGGGEDDIGGMGGSDTSDTPTEPEFVQIIIGRLWTWDMATAEYNQWRDNVIGEDVPRTRAVRTLKRLLGLPTPAVPKQESHVTSADVAYADPADLTVHPDNAREGDIGAVAASLSALGQYRPIVANIQTGHVVVGNHTLQAARALGWKQIAVHWINVDSDTERRILLIDNRTSDLASYRTDHLATLLTQIRDLTGTGYTGDDVDDILRGGTGQPGPPPTGQTTFKIGQYGWRTPTDVFDEWVDGLDGSIIRRRLNLPEDL